MEKKEDRLTKRQIQAINTRKIILDSAVALMETASFDSISIEDICQKAGVSVGAFYHYFETKYDILIEAFNRADKHFKNNVVDKLKYKSSIKNIEKYFWYYARLNSTVGLDTLRLLFNSNNKVFANKKRYLQTLLSDIIKTGQENGEIIDDMKVDEIADYLLIVARGVAYNWCLSDGSYDLVAKMQSCIGRIMLTVKK